MCSYSMTSLDNSMLMYILRAPCCILSWMSYFDLAAA